MLEKYEDKLITASIIKIISVVLFTALCIYTATAEACDKLTAHIGTGLKFAESAVVERDNKQYQVDTGGDFSARFALNLDCGSAQIGIAHRSQYTRNYPFNDLKEPNLTEIYFDVKFDVWDF